MGEKRYYKERPLLWTPMQTGMRTSAELARVRGQECIYNLLVLDA